MEGSGSGAGAADDVDGPLNLKWIKSLTQTLHGTAIYAAPLTPFQPPLAVSRQFYGSPMGRVWVRKQEMALAATWRPNRFTEDDLPSRYGCFFALPATRSGMKKSNAQSAT